MGTMPNCYLALGLIVTTNKHLELGNWHEGGYKYIYTLCMKCMYVNSKHSDSVERACCIHRIRV
jgi:hypothetical protein